MRKLKVSTLAVPLVLFGICTTFQNCDAGFHFDPQSGELSSLGANTEMTGVFGVVGYAPGGASQISSNATIDTGFDYELRATGSNTSSAILNWSLNTTSTTASCSLPPGTSMLKRTLKCTTAGKVSVVLKAIWPDSTISYANFERNVTVFSTNPTPTPSGNANVVEFRIRAGTGGMPWNTVNDPIRVFVGQTLTVYNDDTINHRFHTDGDRPFPHQPDETLPNRSTNFVITSDYALNETNTYDHNAGRTARIFIEALNGTTLYSQANGPGSCASCHGGNVATSNKRGASFTSIKTAIQNNTGGMRGITLSDQELRAIAYILNK